MGRFSVLPKYWFLCFFHIMPYSADCRADDRGGPVAVSILTRRIGRVLRRWAYVYGIANFPVGGSDIATPPQWSLEDLGSQSLCVGLVISWGKISKESDYPRWFSHGDGDSGNNRSHRTSKLFRCPGPIQNPSRMTSGMGM